MSKAVTNTSSPATPSVLTFPNFRLLWLGQIVSSFGDRFSEIAIPIFVLNLTGSAFYLGLTFGIQTLAALLFGLIAGGLSDRWNKKYTLVTSDAVRAIIVLFSFFLVNTSLSQTTLIVLLYVLTFLASAAKQFFLPARISFISDLVPEDRLLDANSLDQASSTAMGFLGAAIAGFVVGFSTVSAALLIDCLSFLISSLFILLIRQQPIEEHEQSTNASQKSIGQDILDGLRYCWQTPVLKGLLILSIIAPFSFGLLQPLLLLFARQSFNLTYFPVIDAEAGDIIYGALEGMFPLGIAFGAYVVGKYATRIPRERLLSYGVIGMGIGELLAATFPRLIPQNSTILVLIALTISLGFFFISAMCNAMLIVGLRTIIQVESPKNMIGRVFSIVTVGSSVAIAAGTGFASLADTFGYFSIMVFLGIFLIIIGVYSLSWKAFSIPSLVDS